MRATTATTRRPPLTRCALDCHRVPTVTGDASSNVTCALFFSIIKAPRAQVPPMRQARPHHRTEPKPARAPSTVAEQHAPAGARHGLPQPEPHERRALPWARGLRAD